jgi:hypothetical protein
MRGDCLSRGADIVAALIGKGRVMKVERHSRLYAKRIAVVPVAAADHEFAAR